MNELPNVITIFLLFESGVIFVMNIKKKFSFLDSYLIFVTMFLVTGVIYAISSIPSDIKGYFLMY